MSLRRCDQCEYYKAISDFNVQSYRGNCHGQMPRPRQKDDNGVFLIVHGNSFCPKWEPKWDDNPVIAEAWELFQTTVKLTK